MPNFIFQLGPQLPLAIVISQYILGILLFVISLFLIFLVLIQQGRGGGLAGALGGPGGTSAFGTKSGDVFTAVTIVTALLWFLLAGFTTWWFNEDSVGSALPETVSPTAAAAVDPTGSEFTLPPSNPPADSAMTAIGETPAPTQAPVETPAPAGNAAPVEGAATAEPSAAPEAPPAVETPAPTETADPAPTSTETETETNGEASAPAVEEVAPDAANDAAADAPATESPPDGDDSTNP